MRRADNVDKLLEFLPEYIKGKCAIMIVEFVRACPDTQPPQSMVEFCELYEERLELLRKELKA